MPDEQDPKPADPKPQEQFPQSWEDVFKHPRFKELNDRAQSAEKRLQELTAAEAKQKEDALKEQNKFKELYEGLQKELEATKKANLRLKVATSKSLPAELVDRLRGETEDELTADADSLLSMFAKPAEDKRQGVPPPPRGGQNTKFDFLAESDPAKIREAYKQGRQQ